MNLKSIETSNVEFYNISEEYRSQLNITQISESLFSNKVGTPDILKMGIFKLDPTVLTEVNYV